MVKFDKAVRNLLKIFEDILTADSVVKTNPLFKRFRNYRKAYEDSDPEQHIKDFSDMFHENRIQFLEGPHKEGSDEWLRTENVMVQFGDGKESHNIRLMISVFYDKACNMRDTLDEQLRRLPIEIYNKEAAKTRSLIYPEIIILHLYEIIISILAEDDNDKKEMMTHYRDLGKSIGYTFDGEDKSGRVDSTNLEMSGMADMFNKMIKAVPLPEGSLPDSANMGNVMANVMKQPAIKQVFDSIMNGGMDPSKGPEDFAQKMLGLLFDPSVLKGIQESVESSTPQIDQIDDSKV